LSGRADIRYDFKRNRVAFIVKDGNKVVDAVGRSIDGRNPKWHRYGNSRVPFIVGDSNRAVIVEDCGSACSISDKVTGVALLGTSLLQEYIPHLLHYQKIYVALDKDATDKAVDMVKILCRIIPTKLMVLSRDFKNMTKEERNDHLRNYIDR
jgi:DNA primase